MEVVKGTLNELEEISRFAYEKNKTIEDRCRPFLVNESLESIRDSYKRYIEEDFFDVLLQYDGERLVGVTAVFWIVEDLYIQLTMGIFTVGNYIEVVNVYMDYFMDNFKGYKLYINTPKEHKRSIDFYNEKGFKLLEDAVLYHLDDLSNGSILNEVELLNPSNQNEIYCYLNQFMTEETYWNVERLKEHPEKFIILGYFQDGLKGTIHAQIYRDNSIEIVGLSALNVSIKKILINALIKVSEDRKINKIQLYTEDYDEVRLGTELGFYYYDSNICFFKTL